MSGDSDAVKGDACALASVRCDPLAGVPFNPESLCEHVRILASDEFEGRETASEGEAKTIAYLSQEFAKLGLQPAGDRGSWTQEVPLRKVELMEPGSIRIAAGAEAYDLRNGHEVVFYSLADETEAAIQNAPLVFVGYGVNAPELDWDDFKGTDLKGKVAVFLVNDPDFESPTPGKFGGKAMTYYGRWTYKFEEAARRGAAAALIVHEDAPACYGWTTVQNTWGLAQFDIARAHATNPPMRLQGWLRRDIAEDLFRKAGLDLDELKTRARAPDFSPVTLNTVGLSARAHLRITPVFSHNLVVKLPGGERAGECIIYCAHWDHLGVGKPDASGDRIYHGAVDNAVAVAGLLELARVFASAPTTARSVYFVAFTAEEKGLLGSEYYVAHPPTCLEHAAAVFNMELVGFNGPALDVTTWGNAKSSLHDSLSAAAARRGRVVVPDRHLEAGYFYRSDHFAFAKRGVPAITIMSGENLYQGGVEVGRKAYDDYIAHRYHRPADRWSPDLDLRGATLDLDVLYQAGWEIANATTWPEWIEGSEFKRVRDASAGFRTQRDRVERT
jgi:Zn-dependent M28 family amino/carboxypeptidase